MINYNEHDIDGIIDTIIMGNYNDSIRMVKEGARSYPIKLSTRTGQVVLKLCESGLQDQAAIFLHRLSQI